MIHYSNYNESVWFSPLSEAAVAYERFCPFNTKQNNFWELAFDMYQHYSTSFSISLNSTNLPSSSQYTFLKTGKEE